MRNKSSKDKGNSKTTQPQMQTINTFKSEGPPVKVIQPTAEQMLLCKLINTEHVDESKFQKDVKEIMFLTGCEQRTAETALHDTSDIEKAVNSVLEGKTDESEWRESGKKKKKPKTEPASPVAEEMPVVESKPEKRDSMEQNDEDNGQKTKDDKENDRNLREKSDNFRRSRRNEKRPPRLSRGRGMPDRNVERPDRDNDNTEKDFDNRERSDRWYDKGSWRGRGYGQRRGRGNFHSIRGGFDKAPSHFVNGPQIDTWTNETAVIGEKEPKISNWSKEDWSEDVDTWTGQLDKTKVFTSSVLSSAPEHNDMVQLDTSTLSNTFDLSALYNKHHSDLSTEAYITQYNQQATESIKNSIGIGSGSSSSLQNSITSQTASNVSAFVSLQRNTLHDMSELTGTGLMGSGLSGNNLVGNSLSSTTSQTVSSMTENALPSTSLGASNVNSFGGNSFAGTSLSGTKISGSLAGLSPVSQSVLVHSNPGLTSVSSAASQMLQQKSRIPKTKLPPPSKIPASAVEMPGNIMTSLDVEFGADSAAPFSFGGNESVSYSSSVDAKSTSAINQIVQGPLNKTNEVLRNTALEQSSRYQQSPYITPTKQITVENSSQINSQHDPLQMAGSKEHVKSTQHVSGQSSQSTHYYDDNIHQESTQQSTKISSGLGSYVPSSSYQSAGYTSHNTVEYQPSGKPSSYPNTQYKSGNQTSTSSNQYSSHYAGIQSSPTQSGSNQFVAGSQYQSPPTGYQSSQTDYQSSQSPYQQPSQGQFQPGPTQFQNFQTGTTFQNHSNYSTSQSNQNSYYPSTTSNSYSSQSQPNSVYSQSSRPNSYSSQSFLNPDLAASAGLSTFQPVVTQATSVNVVVPSVAISRDIQSDNSYSRDTRSATRFNDNSSMTYNRDESVSNSYPRESSVSYNKCDSMSSSGSYPHDAPSGDSGSINYDSHLASASFSGRDSQTAPSGFRDSQPGAVYGTPTSSYPRDTSQSHTQTGYSAKSFRNSAEVSTLPSVLTNSILVDSFSKIAVKDGSMEPRQSTTQFETTTKVTTNSPALTSAAVAVTTLPPAGTTVTSSTITKVSTSTTSSAPSTKGPLNLPPGVPLIPQQYIMGQGGSLPFYRPVYNMEDFQFLQQRLPPYAANAMYDLTGTAAAAGMQIPPTTLMSNAGNNQTTVAYSGATDTSKLTQVDAQSPTGAMPNSQPTAAGQTTAHQQPYILNYGYYYPPSLLPGAGYQYPMLPDHGPYVTSSSMIFQIPQVTNAAHAGTAGSTQYQQKGYGSHLQYGTNKVYDDITNPNAGDFSKGPYGSSQTQSKANVNTSVASGTGTLDIQMSGYGKTHAQQAFDKHGFPAGTPPPFNLQMATAQLASGTQTGPLGAPTAAYGAPFLPMMAPHSQVIAPHSQVMHHPIQDALSSTRGIQPTGSHSQSRTSTKPYGTTNWVSY